MNAGRPRTGGRYAHPWKRYVGFEYDLLRQMRGWTVEHTAKVSRDIVARLPEDISSKSIHTNGLANPYMTDAARAIIIWRMRNEYQERVKR